MFFLRVAVGRRQSRLEKLLFSYRLVQQWRLDFEAHAKKAQSGEINAKSIIFNEKQIYYDTAIRV